MLYRSQQIPFTVQRSKPSHFGFDVEASIDGAVCVSCLLLSSPFADRVIGNMGWSYTEAWGFGEVVLVARVV